MVLKNWSSGTGKKKYRVELWEQGKKIKTIQFGYKGMGQFKDKTPLKLYSNLNHNDLQRKKNYYARHNKTYPKYSPDWFSKKYLW